MNKDRLLYFFFPILIAVFIAAGAAVDGAAAFQGFLEIQIRPARLINDYIYTNGIGAALINSAAVGLIGFIIIAVTKTKLSGPTFAAIFTMMGFGLFGKTPVNILPVIFGVYLAAKYALKSFKEYIIIALFGTALGPLISTIAFELGASGIFMIPAGIAAGIAVGFFLPPVAVSMLHLHQGYNLYNMGLTCGFLSLFAASLIKAGGGSLAGDLFWYAESSLFLMLIIPVISIILLAAGFAAGGTTCLKDLIKIQKQPGRLPSDFIDSVSLSGSLLNAGFIGLIASVYIYIIGGNFNGPVIGGMMTIMGFAAFGTHLKNSWPVVAGVVLASFIFGKPLSAPGVQLAAIFCTTLAPVAGQFGVLPGIIAGFLHLAVVSQAGAWQGGINLYNNGFSGGIVAALIVAVVQWYRSNRKESRFK